MQGIVEFLINAGGFPCVIQSDFNRKLIGGKAAALLRSHSTCVQAAPSGRQDKNRMVEREWQSIVAMAQSFLTEAQLPKKFWHWAVREANL